MANREEKAEKKRKLARVRGVSGAMRKAYFEAGGTLSGWRGRACVMADRRKKQSKNACRGNQRYDG